MNDAAPTSSSTKDVPRVFAERGVTVPFTTAELLWARVRQRGAAKELLVPGLAKTRGIFVYEWGTLRNRFSLSLHDRLLAKEIQIGPMPTPDTIAAATLRVTGSGAAGGDAKAATAATAAHTGTLALHLRFSLIQRVIERLGGSHNNLTIDDLANPAGLRKATDALSEIAHVYHLSGPALYGRLDSLSGLLTPVGLSGLAVEAPNRRLAQRLNALSRNLLDWAAEHRGEAGGEANLISRVTGEIARLAGASLANIDRHTTDVELLLTEWDQRFEQLRRDAERIVWLLDGWERFLKLWQNVASHSADAQAKALVLMSFVIPVVPTAELASADRAVWDDLNAELAKIVASHEEGMDLKTALDLLGPDAGKPLAALGNVVPATALARPRGLAAEKLTQIVRILEPASDRPDGTPAKAMLAELRPQLARLRPSRVRRARRLVCNVFEELLIDGETSGKIAARIPRSAIVPVWALFQERVDKAALAAVESALDKPDSVAKLYELFVSTLTHDLDEARAYTSKLRALVVRLGGEAHFHAMENIVGAVAIAPHLVRLRAALPMEAVAEFDDATLDKVAAVLNDIRREAPNQVQTALFVLMSRMSEPWTISSVLERLATTGRFRSSAGITGFVATAMIGCLEGHVHDVQKSAAQVPAGTDSPAGSGEAAMALADAVEHCAESVLGTNASLSVSGTPGQIEEVTALRDKVCNLVGDKMGEGAAAALISALTGVAAVRGKDGALRPGGRWRFDEPLEPAALRNAELYAIALRRCERRAGVLGIGDKLAGSVKQTIDEFEKVAAVLFGQMRTANLDRVQREVARSHVAGIAYLVELLADAERSERVFNRGLEAIG
jgi:hypothetical protein